MTSTDTTSDAYQYARTIADEVIGLESGELDGYDLSEHEGLDRTYDAVTTWLAELALDVEVTRSVASGELTAVEVTRTVGGPGCWITFRPASDAEVRVVWGSDDVRVHVPGRMVWAVTDMVTDWYAEVTA
jgi:hypothetical protein